MNRLYFPVYILTILICSGFLAACSAEKPYEIKQLESKITEIDDRLQLELQYEISNASKEDYYFTFIFPSYIQKGLMSEVEAINISANSSTAGTLVISASTKKSGEMTQETINAIKSGELPFVEQILIGEMINLNP